MDGHVSGLRNLGSAEWFQKDDECRGPSGAQSPVLESEKVQDGAGPNGSYKCLSQETKKGDAFLRKCLIVHYGALLLELCSENWRQTKPKPCMKFLNTKGRGLMQHSSLSSLE